MQPAPAAARTPEVRQPSIVPVQAPTFQSSGWTAEVEELLGQIAPSPQSQAALAALAAAAQRTVRGLFPRAEVSAFAVGNPLSGTAFGVAVPEADLVVSVGLSAGEGSDDPASELRRMQKSAIRSCTDRLVKSAAFKFRRSAFRGSDPKVTLMATLGPQSSIPVNVFVNSVAPLHCAAIMAECSFIEPRATGLTLMVRRWAKDRGLSHAVKGHLSPYCWTLLAIYYLQAGQSKEAPGPLLPPLDDFAKSLDQEGGAPANIPPALARAAARRPPPYCGAGAGAAAAPCVGELFHGFVHFYLEDFDWCRDEVSVRRGQRRAAPPSLLQEEARLRIEDPFDAACDLAAASPPESMGRIREELRRAVRLQQRGASLSELLEPWAPPEGQGPAGGDQEEA